MNHGVKGRKFGRKSSHRSALLVNLAKELIEHESVMTTLPKAKEIRPIVEKIVTLAKIDTLHNRRSLLTKFRNDMKPVSKLFSVLGKRYLERKGGYLRIIKTGYRQGDCAAMSIIRFV